MITNTHTRWEDHCLDAFGNVMDYGDYVDECLRSCEIPLPREGVMPAYASGTGWAGK